MICSLGLVGNIKPLLQTPQNGRSLGNTTTALLKGSGSEADPILRYFERTDVAFLRLSPLAFPTWSPVASTQELP